MCVGDFSYNGNKVQVSTVGALEPGDRYRTPGGGEMLVTSVSGADYTTVVDLATGKLQDAENTIKLGRDQRGRLYASRYLNDPKPDAVVDDETEAILRRTREVDADEAKNQADKAFPLTISDV